MKLLFFAGSLRVDSCNKKFARDACRLAAENHVDSEYIDIKDYPMPVYDGDIEAASGLPEAAIKLGKKILEANGIVIATPEHNGSIPAALKNMVDWLSRDKIVSLTGKHVLLLAASPGGLGGIRSLWHSRQPFESLGAHVFPGMMGLAHAYEAFNEKGHLKDERNIQQLQKLLGQFIEHVKR